MKTKLTPMLKQFLEIKKKYQEEILFFRMGDFYEMFFEDAHTASQVLDIALTKRQNDVPMCGIPFHASESYITRLIKAGHRVAICEQLETTPSEGTIVKRDVVRIVTPGTVIESNLLASDDNNFLASIVLDTKAISFAFVDVSTGDFFIAEINRSIDMFKGIITRFSPREILFKGTDIPEDEPYSSYLELVNASQNRINDWLYDRDYMTNTIKEVLKVTSLEGISINSGPLILAAGSVLEYLKETHKKSIEHLKFPRIINASDHMMLDDSTILNLELITNNWDNSKSKTLFSVLNHTKTAMGRRLLERNILEPLTDLHLINARLDAVQYLVEYREMSETLQTRFKEIQDLERLLSRFTMGKTFPKDIIALAQTLKSTSTIKTLFNEHQESPLAEKAERLPELGKFGEKLLIAIVEEPALTPEQGRIIAEGNIAELDELYTIKEKSREWILAYQEEEKKKYDIPTLKIKYNRVQGYYIEVSKTHTSKVPDEYLRKQTLVNAERYTTEKLQKFETDILTAADKIISIETKEITRLIATILEKSLDIQLTAEIIAELDYFSSLASAATENNYIRPEMTDSKMTQINGGRHPVVEKYFTREVFIPNDVYFDGSDNILKIITGPNMAGKSTYMRMAAIIHLMAQIGSFVPAEKAILGAVDRIFTRIGASDNISRGESTFLVEMNETATILNNATDRSLVIMDEVGRGTSTFDGMSLAYAIVEYLALYIKSHTLFATHYHELTELESMKGVTNYNVMVKESIQGVEFLHKVVKGSADRSYGIHVAKLAGIPRDITSKAEEILKKLEGKKKSGKSPAKQGPTKDHSQVDLFNAANHLLVKAIKGIDVDKLTPLEALNEINRLKNLIDE